MGPFITARARERQAYTKREQFPTRHDKAVRAQSIRGRMELDGLYVPARAPWIPDLKAELLARGRHDDIVDALGLPDADRAQVILAFLAENPKVLDHILKQLT